MTVYLRDGHLVWEAMERNERQRESPRVGISVPKPYEWRGKWSNPVLNAMAAGINYGDAVLLAPSVSDKDTHCKNITWSISTE